MCTINGFSPIGPGSVSRRSLRMLSDESRNSRDKLPSELNSEQLPFQNDKEWKKYMEEVTSSKGIIPAGGSELARSGTVADSGESQLDKFKPIQRTENAKAYFAMVEKLTPNDMLQKFAKSAPPNVQEAAKSTVKSILGNLPNYALDAALVTTSGKLANLIYQMQMTGYMLKNAEYRMSFTRSLKGLPRLPLSSGFDPKLTEVSGSVTVTTRDEDGNSVSVDTEVAAADLLEPLSREVEALRTELALLRDSREKELSSNLLTYIQALPEKDLARLSSDMSEDVIQSFSMLVEALMTRLGIDQNGPEMAVQQSMSALTQLCMWQLVIGYKTREMEAFDTAGALE